MKIFSLKIKLIFSFSLLIILVIALFFGIKKWTYEKNKIKYIDVKNIKALKTVPYNKNEQLFLIESNYFIDQNGRINVFQTPDQDEYQKDFYEYSMSNYFSNQTFAFFIPGKRRDTNVYNFNPSGDLIVKTNRTYGLHGFVDDDIVLMGQDNSPNYYYYNTKTKEIIKYLPEFNNKRVSLINKSTNYVIYENENSNNCSINYDYYYNKNNKLIGKYEAPDPLKLNEGKPYKSFLKNETFLIKNPCINNYQIYIKNGLYGYTTFDGEKISEFKYKNADYFYYGVAKVSETNGESYFIDEKINKIYIPESNNYEIIRKASENTFYGLTKDDNQLPLLIDKSGEILRKFTKDDELYEFENGVGYFYNHKDHKGYIINENGKITVDLWNDVYSKYSNVKKYVSDTNDDFFYQLKKEGCHLVLHNNIVNGLIYDSVVLDNNEKISVLLDKKGNVRLAINASVKYNFIPLDVKIN